MCSYFLYHIVTVETSRSIITGNEYDRKAGKHSSGRDESDISESGWGTSRVGERVL